MMQEKIRNFAIISHIDHGKSTLADRFLEMTHTVDKRKMQEQFLDQMELERERGITIKMQPVRMHYLLNATDYQLNLIDTPGHIDFSYEVSRALGAVEGVVLLVDATKGIQAQTISNLEMAKRLDLVIVPAINKIDSPLARCEETKREIVKILGCSEKEIVEISARTGQNVDRLLFEIIKRIPPPSKKGKSFRALVFDFEYSVHRGVIFHIRVTDGQVRKGDAVFLHQTKAAFVVSEIGVFAPFAKEVAVLDTGEIGYIVSSIKKTDIASVGDTLVSQGDFSLPPLVGYKIPKPVVWASLYPEAQDEFPILKDCLSRLKLSDSSLRVEEDLNGVLGRGFRCGFLGMLHLEIILERIYREYKLKLIVAEPTVVYKVMLKKGELVRVYSPALFPEYFEIKEIFEPWVELKIILPHEYLGKVLQLLLKHDSFVGETNQVSESRILLNAQMPLRELMKKFSEELKSLTSGHGSFGYKVTTEKPTELCRIDILLNGERVPIFSKIVKKSEAQSEARRRVRKLKEILPKKLFAIKIQAKVLGRIVASEKIPALKKDVTGNLYGGDRTRKMKLWQKQKKGKKRLQEKGRVDVPHQVFLEMIRG
jgi:GTP-binding protein LepA